MDYLFVGLGGAFGAIVRYAMSGWIQKRAGDEFPWGTLTVNLVGCLAIGAVMYFVEERALLGSRARLFLAVGVIGGFTTFSAFGYETLQLMRDDRWGIAFINVGVSVASGLVCVWLGRTLCRLAGV